MILSGQTIRRIGGIVRPFEERTRHELSGLTFGLGPAGYDVRVREEIRLRVSDFALGSTLEHFAMPNDVVGIVHDKSTLARMGLAVQNTVIEPGWRGYLTIEVTNHGIRTIVILAGQPIAQIIFHRLDEETEKPYVGRYQDQPARAVPAKYLNDDEKG